MADAAHASVDADAGAEDDLGDAGVGGDSDGFATSCRDRASEVDCQPPPRLADHEGEFYFGEWNSSYYLSCSPVQVAMPVSGSRS